jgi:hypothetical protein
LDNSPDVSPTFWLNIAPSNSWALFDSQVSTVSTATTSFTVVFEPGAIDTLAVLNVTGASVEVVVKDETGGTIIYESTQSLSGGTVFDWYQYFFFDITTQRTQAIFRGIPLFNTCEVTLTVSVEGAGTVSAGQVVAGQIASLGFTQYGLSAGILDFSQKETDDFGETTFVVRNFSKRMNPTVFVNNEELNRVQRILYQIRAIPALWIASEEPQLEEAAVVYGFYRDFNTEISFPSYSVCTLELEGLI